MMCYYEFHDFRQLLMSLKIPFVNGTKEHAKNYKLYIHPGSLIHFKCGILEIVLFITTELMTSSLLIESIALSCILHKF